MAGVKSIGLSGRIPFSVFGGSFSVYYDPSTGGVGVLTASTVGLSAGFSVDVTIGVDGTTVNDLKGGGYTASVAVGAEVGAAFNSDGKLIAVITGIGVGGQASASYTVDPSGGPSAAETASINADLATQQWGAQHNDNPNVPNGEAGVLYLDQIRQSSPSGSPTPLQYQDPYNDAGNSTYNPGDYTDPGQYTYIDPQYGAGNDPTGNNPSSDFGPNSPIVQPPYNDPGYYPYDFPPFSPPASVPTSPNPDPDWFAQYGATVSPVVLDMNGTGVKVTKLNTSNMFFDMDGSGKKKQIDWAGAGSAVLFYDFTGQGQLTHANQFEFGLWDSSASSDMQALHDVFDSNHDGVLSSSDSTYSDFFVDITNADGTHTIESLAQAGISALNLIADQSKQILSDGSSIDGYSTWTDTSGNSHQAATVGFATGDASYVVNTTQTINPTEYPFESNITIRNEARNDDGSLAYTRIENVYVDDYTSQGGKDILTTVSMQNSSGINQSVSTDEEHITYNTSTGLVSQTTETIKNYKWGYLSPYELPTGQVGTDVFLFNAILQNATTTTTDYDAVGHVASITIARDQNGGGWTSQSEQDLYNPDGSSSVDIKNLNPDGSVSSEQVTLVSADGLTRTAETFMDGNVSENTKLVDAVTIHTDGSRTETVSNFVGTSYVGGSSTTSSADERQRVTQTDLTGGGTADRVLTTSVAGNADGSSTTTQVVIANDGTMLSAKSSTISADGLTTVSKIDLNGAGTRAAPIWTTTKIDTTTYGADEVSFDHIVTDTSANGTLRDRIVTEVGSDGVTRSVSTDATGAGFVGQIETVAAQNDEVTDKTIKMNADGSTAGETVSVSAGTVEEHAYAYTWTYTDSTGHAAGAQAVYDHATLTTIGTYPQTGASFVATEEFGYQGDGSDQGQEGLDTTVSPLLNPISKTLVITSADGHSITTYSGGPNADLKNAGPNGAGWSSIINDTTTVNDDGSLTEVILSTDIDGSYYSGGQLVSSDSSHVKSQETITTSADRRTKSDVLVVGTGLEKTSTTTVLKDDGTSVVTEMQLDQQGDVMFASVTSTSADGLHQTIKEANWKESAATFAAEGLIFQTATAIDTTLNADGSKDILTTVTARDGQLLSQTEQVTSANGLVTTATSNPFGAAHYATKSVSTSSYNADGSKTTATIAKDFAGDPVSSQSITTGVVLHAGTNSTSTEAVTQRDVDGDGIIDLVTTDVNTINADGSQTEMVSETDGTGSIRSVTQTTSGTIIAGLGRETVISKQSSGTVPSYSVETIAPHADGSTSDTTTIYSALSGTVLRRDTFTTSANGLSTTHATSYDGSATDEVWNTITTRYNSDSSKTTTSANYNQSGLLNEVVTTVSGDGSKTTTQTSLTGGSNPVFDYTTEDQQAGPSTDGSTNESILTRSRNGDQITAKTVNTSLDGLSKSSTTISYDKDLYAANPVFMEQNGDRDQQYATQYETVHANADGSTVDTVTTSRTIWTPGEGVDQTQTLGTMTTIVSGDGRSTTVTYADGSGSIVDTQSDVSNDDINGDGGSLRDVEDSDLTSGVNLTSSVKIQSTGNGQLTTTSMILAGALAPTSTNYFSSFAAASSLFNDQDVETSTIADRAVADGAVTNLTTTTTSADGLSTQSVLSLGNGNLVRSASSDTHVDGSIVTTSALYAGDTTGTEVFSSNTLTSWDGKQVTTTSSSQFDGQTLHVTTDVKTLSADGNITEVISDQGSYGTPFLERVIGTGSESDGTSFSSTQYYNSSDELASHLIGGNLAMTLANGLSHAFVLDVSGQDSQSNLQLIANNLLDGLDSHTIRAGELFGNSLEAINDDGSKTVTIKTYFGNLNSLRNEEQIVTSADGLVTTTSLDSDGNGVFDLVQTQTANPDGSGATVDQYYVNSGPVAGQLLGTNTYKRSANDLVTTLVSSVGLTDTTAVFANANGSYEWSRQITATGNGFADGSSSHFVDTNGMDQWSWNDGLTGSSGTITISSALESQYESQAQVLYQTVFGRLPDDSEQQYLAQYIENGVFNITQLATDLVAKWMATAGSAGPSVSSAIADFFFNITGRSSTSQEAAEFSQVAATGSSLTQSLVKLALAIGQYGAEWETAFSLPQLDSNQGLLGPNAPIIQPSQNPITVLPTPTITLASDTGSSATDEISADAALKGTAGANATVTILDGSQVLGNAQANAAGAWSFTPISLSDGPHTFTVSQTDSTGTAVTASLSMILDTLATAPVLILASDSGSSNSDKVTNNGTVNVNGLEMGATWQYSLNAGSSWTDGLGTSVTLSGDGAKALLVRQTDAAGNVSANATLNLTLDTSAVAPTLSLAVDTGSSSSDKITSDGTVNVSGLEAEASWQYSADGGATWVTGSGSSFTLTGDGAKSALVRQTDVAGNVSANSSTLVFTLDTTAPVVGLALVTDSGVSATDSITNAVGLKGTAEANAVVTIKDGAAVLGTATANASGAWTYTPTGLANGAHNFSASQTDVAGNAGTASLAVTLDTTVATPTLALAADTGSSATDKVTNNGTVNVSGLEAGASWQYSTNGGTSWISGTGSSVTLTGDGAKTIVVRQTDAAGNVSASSASLAFTLDTTAPAPTMTLVTDSGSSATDGVTNSVALKGTAEANSIVTIKDGSTTLGTATANASGAWTYTPTGLANGVHAFTASQTDAAGNTGSANLTVTLDTVVAAPTLALAADTGSSATDKITSNGTVNIANLETGATWQYSLNGGTSWTTGTGASVTLTGDGAKSVTVRQTDLAGNLSTASTALAFTLDTAATGLTAKLTTDSGSSTTDFITNVAGLTGTAEAGALITINEGTATLGTTTANASGAWSFTPTSLMQGAHTFAVSEKDTAGNMASAALSMAYDSVAPTVAITTPAANVPNTNVQTLSGTGEAGTTIQLYDGTTALGTAVTVDSTGHWTQTVTFGTSSTSHSVTAKDTDAAGNVGTSAAVIFTTTNVIQGGTAATVNGTAGNDHIYVNSANTTVNGLGGDDVFTFNIGTSADHHTISGGTGSDTLDFSQMTTTVIANLGGTVTGSQIGTITVNTVENVTGGSAADTLIGDANANVLNGGDGDDWLVGRAGADTLMGGNGSDTASYAGSSAGVTVNLQLTTAQVSAGDASGDILSGIENVSGSDYADTITGDAGNNVLFGYGGNDRLDGGDGDDWLVGGAGADTLIGGNGSDTASYAGSTAGVTVNLNLTTAQVSAGDAFGDVLSGIENVSGSDYADTLTAAATGSTLTGGAGNDTLIGGVGADVLFGGIGNDSLNGGDGNDWLVGGAGADTIIGGNGVDTASYADSTAGVTVNLKLTTVQVSAGDASGDILSGVENLWGSQYADTLTGDAGNNTLFGDAGNDRLDGGDGNDWLVGGAGADTLIGGNGIDTASYAGSLAGVTVNLNLTTAQTSAGDASGDILSGIENVVGSDYADTLTAAAGGSVLTGGFGDDVLIGGIGADMFAFSQGFGHDTVSNFSNGVGIARDTLQFDKAVFSDFVHLMQAATQQGADVLITKDAADTITLKNVTLASLTTTNTSFV